MSVSAFLARGRRFQSGAELLAALGARIEREADGLARLSPLPSTDDSSPQAANLLAPTAGRHTHPGASASAPGAGVGFWVSPTPVLFRAMDGTTTLATAQEVEWFNQDRQ